MAANNTVSTEYVNLHMVKLPKFVGGYRLGKGVYSWKLNLEHKPNWLQRHMMKLCFGVVWEDNE